MYAHMQSVLKEAIKAMNREKPWLNLIIDIFTQAMNGRLVGALKMLIVHREKGIR